MNAKRTLLPQVLKALIAVVFGAVVITTVNVSIQPHSKPYYAVIATQRIASQLGSDVETGDNKHDVTNSRAGSK